MLFYVKSEYPRQPPPLGRGTVMIWEWITAGMGFQLVAASASRPPPGSKEYEKYCTLPGRAFCSFIHLISFAGCVIHNAGGVRACVFRSHIPRQVNKPHIILLLCPQSSPW